jgi:hypothetical protein
MTMAPAVASVSAATNLVQNPGFEKLSGGFPQCWTRFGTGKNTGSVSVAASARGGKRAVKVTVTKWTSGQRAVVQAPACAIRTAPGQQLDLSVSYKSTAKKNPIVLFRRDTRKGWVRWGAVKVLPKSRTSKTVKVRTPAIPANTDRLRWAVTIEGKGTLITDDYKTYQGPAAGFGACTDPEGCAKGKWTTQPIAAPLRAIHSVLLHNGKVLLIAGSGSKGSNFQAFDKGTFLTKVFDPKTKKFTDVPTPVDLFCAGHVSLPDGRILVMGGTKTYPEYDGAGQEITGFTGLNATYIFDPADNRYHKLNTKMIDGHWYPSATVLGNGDVFSAGGYSETKGVGPSTAVEKFSWAKRAWLPRSKVKQIPNLHWASYPALTLMQDGRLFYTGSASFGDGIYRVVGKNADGTAKEEYLGPGVYDVAKATLTEVPGLRKQTDREYSMSVLLPPAQDQKVMIIGGGNTWANRTAHGLADIIDLKKADPKYRPAKGNRIPHGMVDMDMPNGGAAPVPQKGDEGKLYVSAVILPDGKVLETGGGEHLKADPVYEASMFNPKTEKFTPMAADPVDRLYHNTAILLPDGRVLTAGSEQAGEVFNQNMSIYSPPYLFRGPRPQVQLVTPKRGWAYGSTQKIRVNQKVAGASLIRPAAVTHSSDPNQRSVALPFSTSGGVTTVKLNPNPNLTPPGWYMLFVTNTAGVPSVARWIHVG